MNNPSNEASFVPHPEITDASFIAEARKQYANPSDDNIEIDTDAKVSRGDDDGAWVAAWVYVRYEDVT